MNRAPNRCCIYVYWHWTNHLNTHRPYTHIHLYKLFVIFYTRLSSKYIYIYRNGIDSTTTSSEFPSSTAGFLCINECQMSRNVYCLFENVVCHHNVSVGVHSPGLCVCVCGCVPVSVFAYVCDDVCVCARVRVFVQMRVWCQPWKCILHKRIIGTMLIHTTFLE